MNRAAQQLGRLGGLAKSAAKTAAARANAKKGGWPKGRPRKCGPKIHDKMRADGLLVCEACQKQLYTRKGIALIPTDGAREGLAFIPG